jgi:MinD-like ATPase involved in chromosome partitioning or flagellar assembly
MSSIISIHSFRGGTGKSNTTANISVLIAQRGLRVGVVDTDIQSPGIHVLFGLEEDDIGYSLNDYLWGRCEIEQTAMDVTDRAGVKINGKIFLMPSSIKAGEIAKVLREGYDVGLLNDGFQRAIEELGLDVLIIDTHPGLNEETLLSIAISDGLVIILRPDSQDHQGTGVTVDVARKLGIEHMVLMVNKVPAIFDSAMVKQRIETAYDCEVAAVLPHSDELMALASSGIFVLKYPNHEVTEQLKLVVENLLANT